MDPLTQAYLSLALTPGLGPRKIKLLTDYFGDAEAIYAAGPVALREVEGIGPKLAEAITKAQHSRAVEQELARAEKLGVRIVPLTHPGYPEALRHIYDPPPVLYLRGALPEALSRPLGEVRAVGIVGTRDASSYALELTRQLATELAEVGVAVVSGLALGVDSAAHEGALQREGGQTVAVLGSGVDVVYPRQNQGLAKRILAGAGALVSEYPIGTSPRAENFPGRNRIISGLARGVVVVEAGQKSGALITAEYALEEGRTVFAVPGRAGDPKAAGVLELLKQGAILTQAARDILEEFGWTTAPHDAAPLVLSGRQKLVAEAVARLGSPLLDDLITATDLAAAELLPVLTLLELQGVVRTVPGGRYIVTATRR